MKRQRHDARRRRTYSQSHHDYATRLLSRAARAAADADLAGSLGCGSASRDERQRLPETPDRAVSRIDVDGRVSPHPLADVDRPHLTPVPASSAAASRRDAPSFAVALAARPDLLPARRSPDVHGPDG